MSAVKPMLAKDGDPSGLSYPVIVQPKLDGIRAMVVGGKLVSRTLKPIPNAEIRAALERPEFEGLDGELLVGDPTADDAYRKTTSFVMAPNKTGEDWCYHVFDKWDHEGSYGERYDALVEALVHHGDDRTIVVNNYAAHDSARLEELEASLVAQGHEGIIVRTPHAPYKFGRSGKKGPLLKIKRFVDFEAEVIGVYEEMHNANAPTRNALGRTERSTAKDGLVGKGRLGGFHLRAINGPAEGVEFKCGTGFDAEQRSYYWERWHEDQRQNIARRIDGAVVKVKSFPIGVKDKPRHPVFLGFRDMEVDG